MNPQSGWLLVVDDDSGDRLRLFRLLERDGYHATVADNGRAALELLRVEPFDLVLLDLVMPDLDGLGMLQAMKTDVRLRQIPVIVVSEVDDLDIAVRCLQLGADDYLEKPIDPVLLRTRVHATLTKKRLQDREDEYLDVVGHLVEAASTAGRQGFDPERLDRLTRRIDHLGQLARVMAGMASEVAELRARVDNEGGAGPSGRHADSDAGSDSAGTGPD